MNAAAPLAYASKQLHPEAEPYGPDRSGLRRAKRRRWRRLSIRALLRMRPPKPAPAAAPAPRSRRAPRSRPA